MGWGLKIGLFAVGAVAAGFGAWIITIPILAFLFIPPLLKRARPRQNAEPNPLRGRGMPAGKSIGILLLSVSFVAFLSGGRLSPIAFALTGFLFLFRPGLASGVSSRVRPVVDSVLLRGSVHPFRWFAIAEAKISTRDPAGALSGLEGRLLLVSAPAPRLFLIFQETSFERRRAEEGIIRRMQAAARGLSPLGVYLLPLDGDEAFNVSQLGQPKDSADGNPQRYVSAGDYDAVTAESENGIVTAFGFYARTGEESKGASALKGPSGRPKSTTFLREFLQAAAQRRGFPQPDNCVSFLSSMAATEGEVLGQRITETAQGRQEQVILVASLGGPRVEMSRAQLRAVTRIYE